MELRNQANDTLCSAIKLLPQVLGQRGSFIHEENGTKFKLDLQLNEIQLTIDQDNSRLYVSTVPTIRRTELVNVLLRVPVVHGLSNGKIVGAVKRLLNQIDSTVVCNVAAETQASIDLCVHNVSQVSQVVTAVTSRYPEVTSGFTAEPPPVKESRGECTTIGYLPLPCQDRPETLGMFLAKKNRHLFIPHLLVPSKFTPFFHTKDGTWKACVSYLHSADDNRWDHMGKAELVVPTNGSKELLWVEAHRQPVACGDVLRALGVDEAHLRNCLKGRLSSAVPTDEFAVRAWQGATVTLTAAQSLLASTEKWASWQSAKLLPWLCDEASKARYLLGLVTELGRRVLLNERADDGGDLCHRVVRTPGEAFLTLARDAGYRFMKAVQASDLFRLTTFPTTTATVWCAAFDGARKAFVSATVAFHQNGTLGKTRETAHEVPRDISQIGRLALTSQVTVTHGVARLGLEVDEVKRRGLHPSELGYMCPSHVNSTANRETGGRTRYLSILCHPTPPLSTSKSIPLLVDCIQTAGTRLQESLKPGHQRLAIVVNSQLAVVLSTAPFINPILGPRLWLLAEVRKNDRLSQVFREINPSLTTQSDWAKSLCIDMEIVLMLDLQPGRLRKPQTLSVTDSSTELVWLAPDEARELSTVCTNPYGQVQTLGIVACTEPLLCHVKGTKSIMSVAHRNRSLSVAHSTQPIMSTAHGFGLRFANMPTVTLKTGVTAMVAIMPLGLRHSNEEDQIVISETAANTMLTHTNTFTKWVKLPYDKVPLGGHVQFISPRNPRLVEGRLIYIKDALPFLDHQSVASVPSAYIIGLVQTNKHGEQKDASITLQEALGPVSVSSAQVIRVRWCVMANDSMSQGTHETFGWKEIIHTAKRLLWIELTLITIPSTKEHIIRVSSDIRQDGTDILTIQTPTLEATANRQIRLKAGNTCRHLDTETGLPAVGSIIGTNDYLCGMVLTQGFSFTDMSILLKTPDKAQSWVVTDVKVHGFSTVCITLEANARPFRSGDKLAFRHGQKGIGVVTPVEKLPFFPELGGAVPDIVLHPCAVTGRCTVALLIEQLACSLAVLLGCRVRTGTKAETYDFLDASTGKLVQSLTLDQMFADGRVPSSSPVVCPISGKIIGEGICAPMTVHRLRQSGEVSAQNCMKIGLSTARDLMTLQPVKETSLRLGVQESDCINACGSTQLLREFRSSDNRPVPTCKACGALLWVRESRCHSCMTMIATEGICKIPHCLLTLRFNLAMGRIHWSPSPPSTRSMLQDDDAQTTASVHPVTLEQALLRLDNHIDVM